MCSLAANRLIADRTPAGEPNCRQWEWISYPFIVTPAGQPLNSLVLSCGPTLILQGWKSVLMFPSGFFPLASSVRPCIVLYKAWVHLLAIPPWLATKTSYGMLRLLRNEALTGPELEMQGGHFLPQNSTPPPNLLIIWEISFLPNLTIITSLTIHLFIPGRGGLSSHLYICRIRGFCSSHLLSSLNPKWISEEIGSFQQKCYTLLTSSSPILAPQHNNYWLDTWDFHCC